MAQKQTSSLIDFRGLFRQYLSKWYLFLISVLVCGSMAYVYTKVKPPKYSVRASILISDDKSNSLSEGLGGLSSLFGAKGSVDDEIYVVSSHSVFRQVAKDLGINVQHLVKTELLGSNLAYPTWPVDLVTPAEMADTLQGTVLFKAIVNKKGTADVEIIYEKKKIGYAKKAEFPISIKTKLGEFTLTKTPYFLNDEKFKTVIYFSGYDVTAENMSHIISTDIASRRANVINLAINTPNPDYGIDVLNEIISTYNKRGIEEKNQKSIQSAKFIDERLVLLAEDLNRSEHEIQEYKQKHNIIDIEAEARYQSTKKGQIETSLIEAETNYEIINMVAKFFKDPANAYSMAPATLDSPGLQAAIKDYNELILRRIDLLNSARPDNAALRLLTDQINAMRENLAQSIEKARETAGITVRDLRNERGKADARLGAIPSQESEYIDMKRQQEVKQELYLFLLQSREENALVMANAVPKGVIIDEAFKLSKPLGLPKKAIILFAILFGLCIPPTILYLRKTLRNRFETRQEVERITDVPILGEMCIDNSGETIVAKPDNTSSAAELFRLMRSTITQFILGTPDEKVIMLTSSTSGEGKTFISINLAASFAMMGKRTILVGLDIRNPRLSQYLDIKPRLGMTQYLASNEIKPEQIIVNVPSAKDLDMIVAGPVPPNPSELLLSPRIDELFKQLRKDYDYIVVDTAPIGLVSDTFTLERVADATIYVCRANYTSLNDLSYINELYDQDRLKRLSIVINGTAAKKTYCYRTRKE